ncbi:MAG: hypothetical protein QW416_00360 [Candidatus Nitrosocaldaceae archaeon]
MEVDGVFVAGGSIVVFGIILLALGFLAPDLMPVLWPVAAVLIACGIAMKVISVKHAT